MTDARAVLRTHRLAPKKSFGQNFLVDANVAIAIAEACVHANEPDATVVELGAGLGALTTLLAPRAKRLVAVERDRDLVPILRETMSAHANVEVVEGDAQGIDIDALFANASSPRVLCGNLPYQITGRLIGAAIEHALAFDRAVFMVQKEVADRLRAAPSTKDYGALTVFAQAAFDVTTARVVSPGCFFPPPDVTSAVVVMTTRRPPRAEETDTFRALVKGAFMQRRKTLRNAWKAVGLERVAPAAEKAGVSLDLRGETLDVEAFANVARFVDEG